MPTRISPTTTTVPMPEPYRADPDVFLGVDLGTHLGYAVMACAGGTHGTVLDSGVEDLSPFKHGEPTGRRFFRARKLMRGLIHRHRPSAVGYEMIRRHGGKKRDTGESFDGIAAAHVYGGIRAVLTELCYGLALPVLEHEVAHIKSFATSKGNAPKSAMVESARRAWPSVEIIDDNHADALWIAERTRFNLSIPF